MIKKLKKRFIIIYMAILSCFLITILAGIYFMVYRSEISQSQKIMETAIMNNTKNGERIGSPPKKTIDFSTDSVVVNSSHEEYTEDFSQFDENTSEDFQDDIFPDFNLSQYGYFDDFHNFDFDKPNKPNRDDYHDYDRFPNHDFPNDDFDNPNFPPHQDDFFWDTTTSPQDNLEPTPTELTEPTPMITESPVVTEPNVVTTVVVTNSPEPPVNQEPLQEVTNEPIPQDINQQQDDFSNTDTLQTDITTFDTTSETNTISDTSSITSTSISTSETSQTTTDVSTVTSATDVTTTIDTSNSRKEPPKDDKKEPYIEYEGNLARNTIYVSTDKNGEIKTISYQYFESSSDISLEQTVSSIISSETMSGKVEIDDIKFRYNVFKKENNNGYDIIFLDRAIEISTLNRLLVIFIGIGTIGLVILFGVSWLLASWAITPIADAWDKQKQFIADASHELKTPLTVIATNTDVILANEDDTVKNQSKWLTYIKSETIRMSKLVSDLLYIAKSDVNEVSMVMSKFNISHTVSGICLVFETVAFESGKILNDNIEEDIFYTGDEDRIKQLVNILIDNAIKHSDINAEITVTLKRDVKDKIKLMVTNTKGEDIPTGMENRLFERFFRIDKARNHNNGSHGLGLNIAQSIVKNHNGTISVSSTCDHVVTFTVIL